MGSSSLGNPCHVRGERKAHALHNSAFLAYVKAQGGVKLRRTKCKTVFGEFIPVYMYIPLFFNTPPVCVRRAWILRSDL